MKTFESIFALLALIVAGYAVYYQHQVGKRMHQRSHEIQLLDKQLEELYKMRERKL